MQKCLWRRCSKQKKYLSAQIEKIFNRRRWNYVRRVTKECVIRCQTDDPICRYWTTANKSYYCQEWDGVNIGLTAGNAAMLKLNIAAGKMSFYLSLTSRFYCKYLKSIGLNYIMMHRAVKHVGKWAIKFSVNEMKFC